MVRPEIIDGVTALNWIPASDPKVALLLPLPPSLLPLELNGI